MQDSVYHPSEQSLQGSQGSPANGSTGYGKLDLARCFEVGFKAAWEQIGQSFAIGFLHLLLTYVILALSVLLVGIFLIPIVISGYALAGIGLVRRRDPVGGLFAPFRNYGRQLGASLLFVAPFLAAFLPLIVFGFGLGALGGASGESAGSGALKAALLVGYLGSFGLFFVVSVFMYFLWGRWVLVFPLIQERNFGVIDAYRESWRVTAPYKWYLMLLVFAMTQVSNLGILLCFVGIFPTMAASMAMYGAAATQLLGEDQATGSAPALSAGS
ncbi:MAG: hypothetical protein K1X75_02805 [Leptospirales bacterium]|nr:hypothetical protein [Leptospirales bacterium]